MRLKEIKPGMEIHCKNDDEKMALLKEADRLGYIWSGGLNATDWSMITFSGMTIHFNNKNEYYDFLHITCSDMTDGVTEFSDLVIPDPELSAEEALLAYDQMCRENYCCNDCPIYGILGRECAHVMDGHIKEIMDAIKTWKSGHERKEPEIETVYICRIIKIQTDGCKRCVHEEDIKSEFPFGGDERQKVEEILKRYCMEHDGEFIAVHEVVSRVKR